MKLYEEKYLLRNEISVTHKEYNRAREKLHIKERVVEWIKIQLNEMGESHPKYKLYLADKNRIENDVKMDRYLCSEAKERFRLAQRNYARFMKTDGKNLGY